MSRATGQLSQQVAPMADGTFAQGPTATTNAAFSPTRPTPFRRRPLRTRPHRRVSTVHAPRQLGPEEIRDAVSEIPHSADRTPGGPP